MLWGGIAGTLPDLDVFANLVTDPMSALAYHRAFTHSIPFAVLAAPIIGLAVHRLYGRKGIIPRLPDALFYILAALALWLLILVGTILMPIEIFRPAAVAGIVTLVFAGLFGLVALRERFRRRPSNNHNASLGGWITLFFLAIVTHPLLDCFTAYGTQLFEPLSSARLAWNTISVADPLYTLPFLLFLIVASRRGAGTRVRKRLNDAGLLVSSLYLLLTVVNYFNVESVLHESLAEHDIKPVRTVQGPTILNNLLWSATAESVAADGTRNYHIGQYSLLDRERRFGPFVWVPGRHERIAPYLGQRDIEIIRWFTDELYAVLPRPDGYLQISDLRYGLIGEDARDPNSYLFSWVIDTTASPVRVVEQLAGPQADQGEMMGRLFERMGGIDN